MGAKLGNMLSAVGFKAIETNVITWHLDNRNPGKRKAVIEYWTDLLLSAEKQLVDAKYVDQEVVDKAKVELNSVKSDPNAVFLYSFMQAKVKVGSGD